MNRKGEQKEGQIVPFIIIDFPARRKKPTSSGTVKGTFDDLSDDEKTKAFLQLLEYKLRLEQEQREDEEDTDRFHELWQRLPSHKVRPDTETEEEKTVRESIQVRNKRICTPLLSCDNKLYTQLEPVLNICTVHYNAGVVRDQQRGHQKLLKSAHFYFYSEFIPPLKISFFSILLNTYLC